MYTECQHIVVVTYWPFNLLSYWPFNLLSLCGYFAKMQISTWTCATLCVLKHTCGTLLHEKEFLESNYDEEKPVFWRNGLPWSTLQPTAATLHQKGLDMHEALSVANDSDERLLCDTQLPTKVPQWLHHAHLPSHCALGRQSGPFSGLLNSHQHISEIKTLNVTQHTHIGVY